uniref:G-protein coupled receptors family 3 profile domain-containing protein n=1 Tax=Varanus komodoensis TaxID=61221 RepID=A0A8D2LQH8_VARKO
MMIKLYQHLLALAFAVSEINTDPWILSNVTLGFHIYDSYFFETMTYRATLDLLFNSYVFVPNYECGAQKNRMATIGGFASDTSFHMADILGLYKIPQLAYGAFPPEQSDTTSFPSFYRMVPNEIHEYSGIVHLLQHLGWIWVGLFIVDDDSGAYFLKTIEPLLSEKGICSACTIRLPRHGRIFTNNKEDIRFVNMFESCMNTTARAFVNYGDTMTIMWLITFKNVLLPDYMESSFVDKVWIMTAQNELIVTGVTRRLNLEMFQGAISFAIHSKQPQGFQKYLQNLRPQWTQADDFLCEFWEQAFECSSPNPQELTQDDKTCLGEEKLENLPRTVFEMSMTGHSYSIYNAVYAIAHALHSISGKGFSTGCTKLFKGLHSYLQGIAFNNSAGEEVSFNQWGILEGCSVIKIHDTYSCPLMNTLTTSREVLPVSVCSDSCNLGFQKRKQEGKKFCCYGCDPCPEGKISNQTALVLGIFIKHKDTPIVKANNRDLTYTLLISLLLCFLCSLIFLGPPGRVNCLIRQAAFGTIFCVAVSCVLAKTITVVMAFMDTKPGSNMRKWMGRRLSVLVILSSTFIQAGICALWLGTFPPFPNMNMHSVPGQIIAECNEGSVIMFYCVLAYMGLLSIISFMVAFLVRKLPDSFNEAKFIVFSMLVFCSVWLSFVPTYLSTKGKYMVAVEIFSILASSAGLLGCIFFPKCYVILLKPELNSKQSLIRRKK